MRLQPHNGTLPIREGGSTISTRADIAVITRLMQNQPRASSILRDLTDVVQALAEVRANPVPDRAALEGISVQVTGLRSAYRELVTRTQDLIEVSDLGFPDQLWDTFRATVARPEMQRAVLLSVLDEGTLKPHHLVGLYALLGRLGPEVAPAVPRLLQRLDAVVNDRDRSGEVIDILLTLREAKDPTLLPTFERFLGHGGAGSTASIVALDALGDFGPAAAGAALKIAALTTAPVVDPEFDKARTEALDKILQTTSY